ncbi:beta-ketoacyl-[acyl-carrier-protein] synthase family protein [Alicyclobacillus sp.]|uniref:beta-ketoacyl-[acyl-carrier-protein] synthase family protein n=1 Tax=Alicyclobacillus sp. TaxID=61169 RepID=UPI0025C3C328|nr:beta-ketoacyl-[acyl-carrier-protein] synthase family protein [Alicyclobacillus sp.]MCL6516850.1 beta-ketoacyl-[acyl-carrier-protein] synthase family protein [Alicyclobacillus sp.]
MTTRTPVVVTGYGAVTPFGVGVHPFWQSLLAGESAIRPMEDEALRPWLPVAAQVLDFNPADHLPRKLVQDTDRFTQLALVAVAEALRHAGLGPAGEEAGGHLVPTLDRDRVGISVGTAFGGVQSLEAGAQRLAGGASRLGPRVVPKSIPNAAAASIAMRYGIRGPVMTYVTACASSANAIGEAWHWLELGECDVVIAGGTECLFTPTLVAGLRAAGAVAITGPEDASAWSRPFDVHRAGMVMGEGAAFIVLETLDHAVRRNAPIHAQLIGYGASNDAYHETAPHPEGSGAALAMQRALRSAGLKARDIDYINAHATATQAGDAAEAHALRQVFGEHLDDIPVSSIKGAVGHLLGTAGAIESIACIEAIRTGWLPPTLHCDNPDPVAPPDVIPNRARERRVRRVLSNSFGFGGQNGVLVWQSPGGP